MSTSMRYASRDGSVPSTRTCPACMAPLASSRARYCSRACKQRAYRARHLGPEPTTSIPTSRPGRARTVYECPDCEARYLDERRCPDCHRFCRRIDHGGPCPHCDEPVALSDLTITPGR